MDVVQRLDDILDDIERIKIDYQQWDSTIKRIQKNIDDASDRIRFNVGGTPFFISKVKIEEFPLSYFYCLLGEGKWEPEEDGFYYIDRSPKYFAMVMDFMRYDGKLMLSGMDKIERGYFLEELEYFQLLPEIPFLDSNILSEVDPDKVEQLLDWVIDISPYWAKKYTASSDGFESTRFHALCDGVRNSLVIVRDTTGNVFGGYLSVGWGGIGYQTDLDSFIYTLVNPVGIPPTQYVPTNANNNYYSNTGYGPTFGGGHDMHIANGSNQNTSSYIGFPSTFNDTTGKGSSTFTTSRNFTVTEIEVYFPVESQ